MKVLMFGWEFPPFNAGGLGTACYGLTKGLKKKDTDITFVLPKMIKNSDANSSHVKILIADDIYLNEIGIKTKVINSLLGEYVNSESYDEKIAKFKQLEKMTKNTSSEIYGNNLFDEVYRYAQKAELIAKYEDYDLIHAHDWMTYQAGIKAKEISNKPLIVHIHATEFDRTCGHPNQYVYDIEREGFHKADKIIAVSNYTKNLVVMHYGINPDKIEVVHNGVDFENHNNKEEIIKTGKTVLYLGRMTIQKGPEYFLYSAKRVLDYDPSVKFIMAGGGDMERFLIDKAAEMGIAKNVLFTGFLRGNDIDRAYKMADLFIMPSVSEPFGITPLEAMKNNTPCIISKTSGISEVLTNCLKIDFWDIDIMSSHIISILNYKTMHNYLKENVKKEVHKHNWDNAANKCVNIYNNLLNNYNYNTKL
jgi:glycogen synthase